LSGDDVRRHIQGARATVLPSFAEGLPVVLMESLALGRPVITTYVAGIPELVRDQVNGWLVPAGSVDALVGAIRSCFQTAPNRLAQMALAGAADVRLKHDASTEARLLLKVFRAAYGEVNSPQCKDSLFHPVTQPGLDSV